MPFAESNDQPPTLMTRPALSGRTNAAILDFRYLPSYHACLRTGTEDVALDVHLTPGVRRIVRQAQIQFIRARRVRERRGSRLLEESHLDHAQYLRERMTIEVKRTLLLMPTEATRGTIGLPMRNYVTLLDKRTQLDELAHLVIARVRRMIEGIQTALVFIQLYVRTASACSSRIACSSVSSSSTKLTVSYQSRLGCIDCLS
jgi:hypothetical protein